MEIENVRYKLKKKYEHDGSNVKLILENLEIIGLNIFSFITRDKRYNFDSIKEYKDYFTNKESACSLIHDLYDFITGNLTPYCFIDDLEVYDIKKNNELYENPLTYEAVKYEIIKFHLKDNYNETLEVFGLLHRKFPKVNDDRDKINIGDKVQVYFDREWMYNMRDKWSVYNKFTAIYKNENNGRYSLENILDDLNLSKKSLDHVTK